MFSFARRNETEVVTSLKYLLPLQVHLFSSRIARVDRVLRESIIKMVLVENWMPPSRENWELIVWGFQWFPLVCTFFLLSYPSTPEDLPAVNLPYVHVHGI